MKAKFLFSFLVVAILFAIPANAQVAHSASLSWSAPADAVAGSTYNVYRVNAACPAAAPGTLTWTKLTGTSVAGLTYTDNALTVGQWCYYVTQVQSAVESAPSNPAGGTAGPGVVTVFTVVVH
jgi:hypothetical protein